MMSVAMHSLDPRTAALVRLSAQITAGAEPAVRSALADCVAADVPARWLEEVVLQSYLFAGFPRALNAAREWRRMAGDSGARPVGAAGAAGEQLGEAAPADSLGKAAPAYGDVGDLRARGENTCRAVYGASYTRLRANITALHPALDEWMIVEGYGKVLSRDGLDIGRRELCIIAACASARQDRQLHSHLLGARNVGVPDGVIGAAVDALDGVISGDALATAQLLWQRIRGK